MVFAYAGVAKAALLKSYDFDNGLSDTLGNGVDLVASGGTVSGGRYDFGNNQGLRLTSALPSITDYAIEMRLRMDTGVGASHTKLIDFQDLTTDLGFYEWNTGLDFWTAGPTAAVGQIVTGVDFTVGLARSGGTMQVFLNGTLLFTTLDASQAVPAANVLNFFEDDFATGQGETFAGSADWIRVHDDSSTFGTEPVAAIPEPSTIAIWSLLGFVGVGGAAWRKRRKQAA